jgi:uncharacterized low-complexity protein
MKGRRAVVVGTADGLVVSRCGAVVNFCGTDRKARDGRCGESMCFESAGSVTKSMLPPGKLTVEDAGE